MSPLICKSNSNRYPKQIPTTIHKNRKWIARVADDWQRLKVEVELWSNTSRFIDLFRCSFTHLWMDEPLGAGWMKRCREYRNRSRRWRRKRTCTKECGLVYSISLGRVKILIQMRKSSNTIRMFVNLTFEKCFHIAFHYPGLRSVPSSPTQPFVSTEITDAP